VPTYDYECEKCANKFELFQKMSDEPVAKCPKCGGKATRLISQGTGIIFKGSGFYTTDYKKKERPKKDDKPSCEKPKSEGCKGCSLNDPGE
jgi:putative FmdB family regulatory protein